MGVDEEHMKVGTARPWSVTRRAELAARYRCAPPVQKTLDQFWLAFDGIKRAFVDKDPLYARWRNGK